MRRSRSVDLHIVIWSRDSAQPFSASRLPFTKLRCVWTVLQLMLFPRTQRNGSRYATRNDIFQMKLKRQYCAERYYVIRTFARQAYIISVANTVPYTCTRVASIHIHSHNARAHSDFVGWTLLDLRYGHCSYFNVFIVELLFCFGRALWKIYGIGRP